MKKKSLLLELFQNGKYILQFLSLIYYTTTIFLNSSKGQVKNIFDT